MLRRAARGAPSAAAEEAPLGTGGAFAMLFSDRYFVLIGVLVIVANFVNSNGDVNFGGDGVISGAIIEDNIIRDKAGRYRVKAATDARTDDSFFIMARTDALAVEGLDEEFLFHLNRGSELLLPLQLPGGVGCRSSVRTRQGALPAAYTARASLRVQIPGVADRTGS